MANDTTIRRWVQHESLINDSTNLYEKELWEKVQKQAIINGINTHELLLLKITLNTTLDTRKFTPEVILQKIETTQRGKKYSKLKNMRSQTGILEQIFEGNGEWPIWNSNENLGNAKKEQNGNKRYRTGQYSMCRRMEKIFQ